MKSNLSTDLVNQLKKYEAEVEVELANLTTWWMKYLPNDALNSFHGEIDGQNNSVPNNPISLVMITRMLWTFSASYNLNKHKAHLQQADTLFEFITKHFTDLRHGGFFWSIEQDGKPLVSKKQIYGQAFVIYAFSEYYEASLKTVALDNAIELFDLIEQYSHDSIDGGYIEAFNRDWSEIEDLRLSEKDANEKKTMNTHLHIVEAYTRLYKVFPIPNLRLAIEKLLHIFKDKIINPDSFHQKLFFDEKWNCKSSIISFGHDIESAWLLFDAAKSIEDNYLILYFTNTSIQMASATLSYIDIDGGLWNELEEGIGILNKEKHWWPQAEAMVGFFNAYELSGQAKFLDTSLQSWDYIQSFLIDKKYGEWFWGYDEHGNLMQREKAGFWKCSYHNSRACIEIIKRVRQFTD